MTDAAADTPPKPPRSRKIGLILALVLSAAGAAAGYFAVSSGVIPIGAPARQAPAGSESADIAFVELDPIMISLAEGPGVQRLRFRAQLEVDAAAKHEVESLAPRVMDVLNGYLRVLRLEDLRDPLALPRLRGHMLRRVQVVVGRENVRDLLIMEFVLN